MYTCVVMNNAPDNVIPKQRGLIETAGELLINHLETIYLEDQPSL